MISSLYIDGYALWVTIALFAAAILPGIQGDSGGRGDFICLNLYSD